jgi:hypothetical protein
MSIQILMSKEAVIARSVSDKAIPKQIAAAFGLAMT